MVPIRPAGYKILAEMFARLANFAGENAPAPVTTRSQFPNINRISLPIVRTFMTSDNKYYVNSFNIYRFQTLIPRGFYAISFADSLYTPTQRLLFVFSFVDPVSFRGSSVMNGLADEHPPSSIRPCRNQSNHLRQFLHIIRAQEPTQHLLDI